MTARHAVSLTTAAFLAFLAMSTAAAADLANGQRIFETVCAACHGPGGRPDPDNPVMSAFDPLPADLSDPLFNSREPAGDWELVVKHGGHALGLSAQMPAQGDALSQADVRDVVAYVKTLADTRSYPPGEMNFFLPVRTKKAFPEDEIVWKSRWDGRDGEDVWRNVLEVEKRLGRRGQGLVEVIHEDDGATSEITEVEIGYKHALWWNAATRSILSAALVVAIPTDSDEPEEVIPYLAYGRAWSDRWVFQGSLTAALPTDDAGSGEAAVAGAVHYRWTPWPRRVFPGLELTATIPFRDPGGDRVQFTVVPQLRFGLTRGGHVALNLGLELPLSDQSWDYRAHLNLLWDFADGSFFKGW